MEKEEGIPLEGNRGFKKSSFFQLHMVDPVLEYMFSASLVLGWLCAFIGRGSEESEIDFSPM